MIPKTFCVWIFGLTAVLQAEGPGAFAIKDARIVTVSSPAIERGTVLVRDGLIEAVGQNLVIPPDAWVIEGKGLTVYPGLIDALSTWGIPQAAPPAEGRPGSPAPPTASSPPAAPSAPAPVARGPEDRPSNHSWVRAADLVSPTDKRIEAARSVGFTTAVTFPPQGIFAGEGAVIDLAGAGAGQMVVASPAGQYLTFATSGFSSFPGSLMGVIAYIRQIYLDLDHYDLVKAAYAKDPRGMQRPEYDRALEGLGASKRLLLPANRLVEVDRMLRLAAELKQNTVLYGGIEAYRPEVGELLKKNNTALLVNLRWPERPRDSDPDENGTMRALEQHENAPSAPAALRKAGAKFAFYSGGIELPRDLNRAVKRAIDAGLSREDAVRALTLSPAEIYGVADRVGSVEKGKIANLVVTRGEIFEDRTTVEMVIVDGKKYTPLPEAQAPQGGIR